MNRAQSTPQCRFYPATLALAACLLLPAVARGSAVEAGHLSLPKGPGSVEGLGRSFEPSPATGTASYAVDIAVPPAISGFGPALSLVYDGGTGATEVGMGWALAGLPRIRRGTDEGLPHFNVSDRFELVGLGGIPDFVEVTPNTFRSKHETGAFVRVRHAPDGTEWEARSKDGTTYRFGGAGCVEADGSNTATYLLREQLDLHGHRIAYAWNTEGGWARLTQITWNDVSSDARLELTLTYEPRADLQLRYSSGIRQSLAERLKSITVKRGGQLVRSYSLIYANDKHSRLARLEVAGSDGQSRMPPLSFDYTAMELATANSIVAMSTPPGRSPADPNTALSDLNGDGLPDLLVAEAGQYRSYLNQDGKSWLPAADWSATVSPSASLGTTGVQLADMDGDGAVDLVIKSGTESLRYFPGNAATSFSPPISIATVPSFSFEDPDVRLADMDGDRRVDAVVTTATGLSIGYNLNGTNWTAPGPGIVVDPAQPLRFSDGHSSLCDVNGDRVEDVCYLRSGSLVYWLGRGRGAFETAALGSGVPAFDVSDPWRLVDLDGDGWLDLAHVGVSSVSLALATGIGQFAPAVTLDGTPSKTSTGHVEFIDVNGNGTTDILWIDVTGKPEDSWRYLELFPKGRAGLLSQIDNGLGRITRIAYAAASSFAAKARASSAPWTTRINVAMPVVTRIEIDSSLNDPLLIRSLEYGNGTWDPKLRSFAGFGNAVVSELGDESTPTLLTQSKFDTGLLHRVLRGLPTETVKLDTTGYVFSRSTPAYQVRTLAQSLDGTPIEFGYKASETTTLVEGKDESAARTLSVEWQYDDFGNVITESNWGEVVDGDRLAGSDELVTQKTYADLESDWILGRLASVETLDGHGNRVALRRQYYDGEPFTGLPLGQVSRGDLRRIESWIAGDHFATESRFDHDEHGNVVAAIDARGSRSEMTYDSNHQFLIKEERFVDNSTSLVWHAAYDGLFGAITSLTDANGHETRVSYDAFGRVTSIVKPGDSLERPTLSFEYAMAAPLSAVKTHARERSGADGTMDKVVFVDGLGRSRATFSEGSQGGSWILSELTRFDGRGSAEFTAYPSVVNTVAMPPTLDGLAGTTQLRDALGRVRVTRHPDGAEARTDYAALSETVSDENDNDTASSHFGTPTIRLHDGLGRLRRVIEREGGRALTTGEYSYDSLGNLLSVADALGRERRYQYDGRSRRTRIDDPNAGSWSMSYTDANDLESRSGPDGSLVSLVHDAFGRVLEEHHQTPNASDRVAARFHYDSAAAEHPELENLKGQLAWVEDDAGTKYFGYDARGRATDSIRHWFDGVEHRDWTDFDAQDRMTRRGFPNRTHVTLSYDSRGLLSSISGVARDFRWEPHGALASVTLGNGIVETRHFDLRQRLDSMSALDPSGAIVRGFSLSLDAASRIAGISDLRPGVAPSESLTAQFTYDDRDRLRKATYAAGETTWELDDLAKITKVTSSFDEPHLNVTNSYGDGTGPDRLTCHGSETFLYDAAGRVVRDGERELTWDAKGRLVKVVRGTTTEEYVYGHDDRRALKKTTTDGHTELTRYIAADVEERDGNIIRYVFLGEARLVRLDPIDVGPRTAPVTP